MWRHNTMMSFEVTWETWKLAKPEKQTEILPLVPGTCNSLSFVIHVSAGVVSCDIAVPPCTVHH